MPDVELCDDTSGIQGSTQGSPAMPASSRISLSLLSQEEARVSLVWHWWRMGALRHLSETFQAQYTPVVSPLLFIPAAGQFCSFEWKTHPFTLPYVLLNSVAYDINSMFQVLQHFGFGEFKESSTKMLLL